MAFSTAIPFYAIRWTVKWLVGLPCHTQIMPRTNTWDRSRLPSPRQFGQRQQVGPPLEGPAQRQAPPPARDLRVEAGEQDLGHRPIAEFRRARVLRVLQEASAVGLFPRRIGAAQHPGL